MFHQLASVVFASSMKTFGWDDARHRMEGKKSSLNNEQA